MTAHAKTKLSNSSGMENVLAYLRLGRSTVPNRSVSLSRPKNLVFVELSEPSVAFGESKLNQMHDEAGYCHDLSDGFPIGFPLHQ